MKTVYSIILLLMWTCAGYGQPVVVQSASYGMTHGNPITLAKAYLPNGPSTTGNLILVGGTGSGTLTGVTDDGSNTYIQAGTTCTNGNSPQSIWYATSAASTRVITPAWATKNYATVWVMEIYNYDSSTPIDTMTAGTNPTCGHTTGTSITAGSGDPVTNNALAVNYVIQDSTDNPINRFTNGAACGGFTTQLADVIGSQFVQTATVASGACNADATQDSSKSWSSTTVFIRPGGAGTAPATTGLRILRDQHHSWKTAPCTVTPMVIEFAGTGNLWILRWVGAPNETLGAANGAAADPTDDGGNTWTEIGVYSQDTSSGVAQIWICKACTGSNNMRINLPFANTCAQDSTAHIMDVSGYDTKFVPIEAHNTGDMLAGTALDYAVSLTPTSRNGMIVAIDGHASNTSTASSVGYFTSSIMTTTPATSPWDENNFNALYYNGTSLSAFQPTSTNTAAVGKWAYKAVFFQQLNMVTTQVASGYQAAASTYNMTIACSGSNRYIVVGVTMLSVAGTTVTGITHDSVALTKLGHQASVSGAVRVELWGLKAPATGSKTVAVTLSASIASSSGAVCLQDVDQTTSTEGFNGAQATNVGAADATVSITTVATGDIIVGVVGSDDTAISTPQGYSQQWNTTGATGSGAGSTLGDVSTGGANTYSFTSVAALATWAIAGVGVRPISASATATKKQMMVGIGDHN